MKKLYLVLSVLLAFSVYTVDAAQTLLWTENFEGNRLSKGWKFRDLRTFSSVYGVTDGSIRAGIRYGMLCLTNKVHSLSIEYEETEPLQNPTIQWCKLKED